MRHLQLQKVSTLQKSIETSLKKYTAYDELKIASTLDPRFKMARCRGTEEKQEVKTLIYSHMPVAEMTEATSQPSSKHSRLMGFMKPRSD